MKILSLLVVLIFINCCIAASNRSSVWLLANSQIFTTNSQTSQSCQISAVTTTSALTATSSIALLTTSNLAITGTFVQLSQGWGTAGWVSTATPYSILNSLTLQFIYNSSYYIQLTLTANTGQSAPINVANLFGASSTYFSTYISSSVSTLYPIVFSTNTILTPTGTTWISVQNIPSVTTSSGGIWTSGILITDYISSSTIAITQYTDADAAPGTTGEYNAFYQLGVRTLTSKISSTSTVLTSATGCTSSGGRKRSVEHLIQKRTVCTSAASIDPSMTQTILQAACSAVTPLVNTALATANTAQTKSDLGLAFNYGTIAMNALYQVDTAIFSAGGSKYTTAVNFGFFIAMSSIIFSL